MRRVLVAASALLLVSLLAACGGGDPPLQGTASPQAAELPQASTTDLDASTLMDWAERQYAAFFPTHEPNQTLAPYLYRHYANGNYLGVADGQVYILGPVAGGSAPVRVGSMAQFTCAALPANCAATGATMTGTVMGKGVALASATVTVRDAVGTERSTTTNASGTYNLDISAMAPPYVLGASGKDASGSTVTLRSVGRNASGSLSQQVNATAWTTALAAMLSPTGRATDLDPVRDRTRITNSLTAVITYSRTLLAPSLVTAGVSSSTYDPIAGALTANGQGMAALYAGLTVGITGSSNAVFMGSSSGSPCTAAQLGGCVRYGNPETQTTTNPNACGFDIATGATIPCDSSLPVTSTPATITLNPSQAYNFGCLGCVFWGPADDFSRTPSQTPLQFTPTVVVTASTWYAHFSASVCVAGFPCVSQGVSVPITAYQAQASCEAGAQILRQTLTAAAIAGFSYSFVCNQTP